MTLEKFLSDDTTLEAVISVDSFSLIYEKNRNTEPLLVLPPKQSILSALPKNFSLGENGRTLTVHMISNAEVKLRQEAANAVIEDAPRFSTGKKVFPQYDVFYIDKVFFRRTQKNERKLLPR